MIVAATGHRPQKLGGDTPQTREKLLHLARMYLRAAQPGHVISGMALGWDQAVAEAAIRLSIPFTAAMPFRGYGENWSVEQIARLNRLLEQAQHVEHVSAPGYARWKLHERNQWMVDRADKMVALWSGEAGGTGHCIMYAGMKGVFVENLWQVWQKMT